MVLVGVGVVAGVVAAAKFAAEAGVALAGNWVHLGTWAEVAVAGNWVHLDTWAGVARSVVR